ncbi:MAG: TonB-dependent receptor [Ignavibacteria bacterium]
MYIIRFLLVNLIFLFLSFRILAKDSTAVKVFGVITNEKSQRVAAALLKFYNVKLDESKSVYSDQGGRYDISLKAGEYQLQVSAAGYDLLETIINITGQTKEYDIVLTSKTYTLDEINVEGVFKQSQSDLRTSLFNVSPLSVKILPGGLEDVLRSLKALPGITSPNDFSSQLVVRGSGPDQNLIIMDEVEVFSPYRLYGLVSMFNPETLSDINLMTGGFPAKYGDRLSAVLDVVNREGIRDRSFAVMTNVNIANANLIFEGKNPFKIPGSWLVSSRRTYYDLIVGPFARKSGLITDDSSFPSFQDLQVKWVFGPFDKSKFLVNAIVSRDGVDIVPGSGRSNPDSVNATDVTHNNLFAIGWHYIPSQNFLSKTTFSMYFNDGDNSFDGDILDPLIDKENLTPSQRDSLKAIGALLGFNFKSRYKFYKYSLTNRAVLVKGNNKFEFGGGIDFIRTDLSYTLDLDDNFKAYIRSLPNARALLEDFNLEGKFNLRSHVYGQGRFMVGKNFYYQPSIRFDYYSFLKAIYVAPRFSFGYAFNPLTTVRSSVGLYFQSPGYEKLIDNQTFYDLTGTTGENLKAERAIHFVLGFDRWLSNQWQLRIEAYYKRFDNILLQQKVTTYRYKYYLIDPNNTDPNYIKNPSNWIRSSTKLPVDSVTTNPINGATGAAYGIEFSIEKKYINPDTKVTGWFNLSLSRALRKRDDIERPFRFDQPIVANFVLNYRLKSWLELGIKWTFASNFPFTPPIGITPRIYNDSLVVNPLTNQVLFNLDYGNEQNLASERRPDYHRLDLRFTAYTSFLGADWSFYLDIINVYNRKNVLSYRYTLTSDLKIKREVIGMIPILPTIGFSAKF